jgi:hypothetical protein
MHIYDGYFDVNQILASQKFSNKYFLFRMYYLGFFIAERISGMIYVFNFSGGNFGHLLRKCDCCEKKYLNFFKIFFSFVFFIEWLMIRKNKFGIISRNLPHDLFILKREHVMY